MYGWLITFLMRRRFGRVRDLRMVLVTERLDSLILL